MKEPPPTHDLIEGLAAGRTEAYAALYDRLGTPLFRFAQALLRSHSDAEDVVQEVFISLVKSRHALPGVDDLAAYLFASLRHAAYRHMARKQTEHAGLVRLASERAIPAEMSASIRDEALETALNALPNEQREVIALKIDGGLTFAQIAVVLEVSINTAASRYRYGLETMRKRLEASHS